MQTITLDSYNALHTDHRGVWETERDDLANWAEIRNQYIGKRTMTGPGAKGGIALLIEGLHFVIVPDIN